MARDPADRPPPPSAAALLNASIELVIVTSVRSTAIPAPLVVAVLFCMVEFTMSSVPASEARMAPPTPEALPLVSVRLASTTSVDDPAMLKMR